MALDFCRHGHPTGSPRWILLARRIAGVLGQARKEVQMYQVCHFYRADEDYGRRVAEKLGIDVDEFLEKQHAPEPVGAV